MWLFRGSPAKTRNSKKERSLNNQKGSTKEFQSTYMAARLAKDKPPFFVSGESLGNSREASFPLLQIPTCFEDSAYFRCSGM